jgi:two-component system sensor histidine kinase TtrS
MLASPAYGAGDSGDRVRIGVLAYQGAEASAADWSHLPAHLNRTVPGHRFELVHLDLGGLREAVAQRRVDFLVTNGGHYVALEADLGISRIVTLSRSETRSPDRAIGSAIIVRGDRVDIKTAADLRKKKIAAVAPDAFGGYLVAARELLRHGIDLSEGDARVDFVGLPMQGIVDAVVRGAADAGIVRACLPEQLVARGVVAAGQVRVLGSPAGPDIPCAVSTELYPDWPLAKARHTDLALAKAVATSLLSMPATAEGISWAVPADYQAVLEMYRDLKAGPYVYLRGTTMQALAQKYWPYLLLLVLTLTAFIVHVVRVEHLVKRRTAELSEALSARSAAEARMRHQQEQAEHLSRLSILGELSGTLAHELNQPLTTIATYAQGLQRRVQAQRLDPAALEQASGEIATQAERAAGIIQRIRAFARKRAAVHEDVALLAIVREAVALFSGMMPGVPHVMVEARIPAEARVRADPLQVQQVLLNLLKNAADATEQLPPARRAITVTVGREDEWLRVTVCDHGPALTEDLRSRLFEPFYTTKQGGLGLGLSICKTIVEAHGGRLTAQARRDGPGLAVSFTLPSHQTHG